MGPVLFIIYINNLDSGLCCKISKFADDTKVGYRYPANTEESNIKLQLQQAIDKVTQWSDKWQMSFNLVMHRRHDNQKHNYTIAGKQLKILRECEIWVS